MLTTEEAFRRLAIGDPRLLGALGGVAQADAGIPQLDERTETLLRIGALVALDASQSSYQAAVSAAQRAGADLESILAVLGAVADAVGSARVISAAPRIALAAGYDVDAALERLDPLDH
jgi:alkylhydroperoxidase/carboxymuconolactone decarboxylase family protein YurZ